MVILAAFLRTNIHPARFPGEGSYIDLHVHLLSLILLEGFIYSFFLLEVGVDGGLLYLEIVIL